MSADLHKAAVEFTERQRAAWAARDERRAVEVRAELERFKAAAATRQFDPDDGCEVCNGDGWIFETDGRGVRRAKQRCSCQQQKPQLSEAYELPREFVDARLDNYHRRLENAHGVQAAQQFVAGDREHLFIFGSVGTGKSRLAASASNELRDRGIATAFFRIPFLILAQQMAMDSAKWKGEAVALLDHAMRTAVAVLDDVAGGERASDFSRGLVLSIVERRFDKGLRTIVTSNLSLEQLSNFYSDNRISSRICGACVESIELGGPDWRRMPRPPVRPRMRVVDR